MVMVRWLLGLIGLFVWAIPSAALAEDEDLQAVVTPDFSSGEETEEPLAVLATSSWTAPGGPRDLDGPRLGRATLAVGAGWPDVFLEVNYGRSEHLSLGLRLRYFFGAPWGLFEMAAAVALELPLVLRLGQWGVWSLDTIVAPGVAVAWDRRWVALSEEVLSEGGTAIPVEARLSLGLVLAWRFAPPWMGKLGLVVPARLAFVLTDDSQPEPWRFDLPLALSVTIVRQLTAWLACHLGVDVGLTVTHLPLGWSDGAFEVGTDTSLYLNATAGFTFSPWPGHE